jgi:hypothetical protein
LAKVYPLLQRREAFFKVAATPELLVSLNSGLQDYSQVGKFLTIYPRSTAEAVELAAELHQVTKGMAGPRIPFDVRYCARSVVYYRYGAFAHSTTLPAGFLRGPGGRLYRDRRSPGRAVPDWLNDPFKRNGIGYRKSRGLILDHCFVYKAKMQRGKGGVYEAVDLSASPARRVIIKEGRKHGETDIHGYDGGARVKHEGRTLRALRRAGLPVPEVYRELTRDGDRYLIMEWLSGRPLIPLKRTHPAQYSWRRAARILRRVQPLLEKMHAAGWVWRDCKPTHIFLDGGTARVIDFEGACRISDTTALPWGSSEYVPRIYRRQFATRRAGTLEDDYALGVIAFQFLTGEFPSGRRRQRAKLYRRAACPDSLRERIERLIAT